MNISANKNIDALLVDTLGAKIPYSQATLQLNSIPVGHYNHTPVSELKNGKFRRLFDRHTRALIY